MAEHRFRKAGVVSSNLTFGFGSIDDEPMARAGAGLFRCRADRSPLLRIVLFFAPRPVILV